MYAIRSYYDLHYSVIEPPERTGLRENFDALTRIIYDTVMEFDGSISAEHRNNFV